MVKIRRNPPKQYSWISFTRCKNNERVIPVSINTRGIANSYQFIDKAFDGTNSKQHTTLTRSMSEPDNIDWLSEDIVDPIVKSAYEK